MMPMEKQTDSGNALLMFLLGAATAPPARCCLRRPAVAKRVAILVERARDACAAGASDAASRARDAVQQGRQAAVATFDDWRPAGNAAGDSGRQVIEQGKQVSSSAVAQGREAYQQAKTRDLPTT
jgi:hypothetical protein